MRELFLTICGLLFGLAQSSAAQGGAPLLEHGPPWLGMDLELTVRQAPPHSSVRLLASEGRGSQATPYGLLELDRARIVVAATGPADALGVARFWIPIPLDPALAETEVHYQALVVDASAPGGAILTQAAHLRRVGPRFYASTLGRPASHSAGPAAGGLAILSAQTRALVAMVDYGVPASNGWASRTAEPVFARDLSRAAIHGPDGILRIFEPFFGEVLHSIPYPSAMRKLALMNDGSAAVLLQPMASPNGTARLRAIDLHSGAIVATLVLPRPSTGAWTYNPALGEAYVVERDVPSGQNFLRRIGLDALTDLGAVPVGLPGDPNVVSLASDPTGALVSSGRTTPYPNCRAWGEIMRVDTTIDPPHARRVPSRDIERSLAPVPEVGLLFSQHGATCVGPSSRLVMRSLDTLAPLLEVPLWEMEGTISDMAWDGRKLWIAVPRDSDGLWALLWFHPQQASWTVVPGTVAGQPHSIEIVRDALVGTAGLLASFFVPDTSQWETRFAFIDLLGASTQQIPLPPYEDSLLGVALPAQAP